MPTDSILRFAPAMNEQTALQPFEGGALSITSDDVRAMTQTLLARRISGGSVCPSEVARAIAAAGRPSSASKWRDLMPAIHLVIDQLVTEGAVRLSWKGKALPMRSGPYRIMRSE